MEQFLADSRACRLDSQAAGPETRYYTAFVNFFQRILPNSVVLGEGQFDTGRPDFRLYHNGEEPQSERLYCLIEAKSHGTDLLQLIATDPSNDNQLRRYLSEICPNLILTNYWEYIWLNFTDDEITIVGGDENIFRIAPTEAEFWDLENQGEVAIQGAHAGIQEWLEPVRELDAILDTSRNGVINSLMNIYRSVSESFQSENLDIPHEIIRDQTIELIRRMTPRVTNERLPVLCGQTAAISMLISRHIHPDNLLHHDLSFIRNATLRTVYSNLLVNGEGFGILADLERTAAILCGSDLEWDDIETVEAILQDFMIAGEEEFQSQELGLRLTPIGLVRFMVARLHARLQAQGDYLARGLLSDHMTQPTRRARVLDPCVGTGRFYIEVLRFIYQGYLNGNPENQATARNRLLRAIGTPEVPGRIYAFDFQPTCVIFTRFRLELFLGALGIENVTIQPQIYATDSLQNWPGQDDLAYDHLEEEEMIQYLQTPGLHAVQEIKMSTPLNGIIGNPPWSGFDSPDEGYQDIDSIRTLLRPWEHEYNQMKRDRGEKVSNMIYDPYMAFIRVAMMKGQSQDAHLITSFVVPDSVYWAQTWAAFRRILSEEYTTTFDLLGGQQRRTGDWQRGKIFDVDTGSCIITFEATEEPVMQYRIITPGTASEKLETLTNEAANIGAIVCQIAGPHADTWYHLFWGSLEEFPWPNLNQIGYPGIRTPGMKETRNLAYIHPDQSTINSRLTQRFFLEDFTMARNASEERFQLWTNEWSRYIPEEVHQAVVENGGIGPHFHEITYKPMTNLSAYADHTIYKFWDEIRAKAIRWGDTEGFVTIPGELAREGNNCVGFFHLNLPGNINLAYGNGQSFPLFFRFRDTSLRGMPLEQVSALCQSFGLDGEGTKSQLLQSLPADHNGCVQYPNISNSLLTWLDAADCTMPERRTLCRNVWYHVLSMISVCEYEELPISRWGVGSRIPFPNNEELMQSSSRLGQFISELQSFSEIGDEEFRQMRDSVNNWIGQLNPVVNQEVVAQNIRVQGWTAGKNDQGRIDPRQLPRQVTPSSGLGITNVDNQSWESMLELWNLTAAEVEGLLGVEYININLNPNASIQHIPRMVYNFRMGGHLVLNNWMAWREFSILGRNMNMDDFEELQNLIVNISCLLLLGPQLAANFVSVVDDFRIWQEEE